MRRCGILAQLGGVARATSLGAAVARSRQGERDGTSLVGNTRRAAYSVDTILKGVKPADLPVEFPTRPELAVNLRAAKSLGLAVPSALLATADEVIE